MKIVGWFENKSLSQFFKQNRLLSKLIFEKNICTSKISLDKSDYTQLDKNVFGIKYW